MKKHVMLTRAECQARRKHNPDDRNCPVCDWELGVCRDCGAAEIELTDEPDCDKFLLARLAK